MPNTTDVSLGRIASQTITLEEYREGMTAVGEYSGHLKVGDRKVAAPVDADDPRLLNSRSVKTLATE